MAATKSSTKKGGSKKGPCWTGYKRVPGTKAGTKGSCKKA